MADETVELCFKWSGKELKVNVAKDETVADVKHKLQELTQVNPKRQKIMVRPFLHSPKQARHAAAVSGQGEQGAQVLRKSAASRKPALNAIRRV